MTVAALTAEKGPVLFIDLLAIFRAAWHANSDGELSVAFQATIDGVRRAIGQSEAAVAVCCDGKGSANFRRALSPDYKANREKQPDAMYGQLERVKDRLRRDGHLLWECDGYEADDVIATATDIALTAGHSVTIASHDKDLLQLMGPRVRYLKTSTWEEFDESQALAKFGVAASQIGDWLALVGDASDNVRGIPGVGPKTAMALLTQFKSIDGIFDQMAVDITKVATPSIQRALTQNLDVLTLARKLVTLRFDAPLSFEALFVRREPQRLTEEPISMDDSDAEKKTPTPDQSPPPMQGGNGKTIQAEGLAQPTALAVVPASYEYALEPTHLGQAQKLAAVLHESRMYPKLMNDAQIFAVILRGRELGLGALVALDVFQIVEGRLSPSAHFIIAKAKAHPDCEYFQCIESTPAQSTWETKNRTNPKPTRHTYALEQAKLAGRVEKERGQWTRMPAEMCRKMAGVQLARMEYPEAALGLYADEELGESE